MSPHRIKRLKIIGYCLTLALGVYSLYTLYWWQDQRITHAQEHHEISEKIARLQAEADTTLESFAAFQSQVVDTSEEATRDFARLLIKRNPHVYCLQIMQRVPHDQINDLEVKIRSSINPNFQVHDFDYDGKRSNLPLKYRDFHYPITFMEPLPPSALNVLGLDIDAVNFLRSNREKSGGNARPYSTPPFRLIEGDIAYGMTLPTYYINHSDNSWPSYVGLVIKASSLQPNLAELPEGWLVRMQHASAPHQALFEVKNVTLNRLDTLLFPKITLRSRIPSDSQPFELVTEQQLGWSSWQGPIPLALAILLGGVMMLALRWQHSERLRSLEARRHRILLTRWATCDALTHCSNRQSFDRRMAQAAQRNEPFTLIYLDLNGFKPINDQYGHLAGDAILKEIGTRLRQCVRSQDLVARWGGDEFAMLIFGLSEETRYQSLCMQIEAKMQQAIVWHGKQISISASIGYASFPHDSPHCHELVRIADGRMYQMKQGRTVQQPPDLSCPEFSI
ncbi:sensor domain-containing diguanylate cyclase [Chitinibacter bivalviorum]|uniref:Sensor domain-containing diguanylate cyclase n=1 Tax=Chitinibacter bivalviorum TaxID=2739434 RepID=A0A7H9BFX1_9NEIS|nr:sensor domain-containing diguanylate cyclase [Chitinibacter bivalviorum]QLG87098.1 sensor domain-containing diguanylate cyclase [Chitinibacter bivalviorum]